MRPAAKKERAVAKAMSGLAEMLAKYGMQTDVTPENAKEVAREAIIAKPLPLNEAEAVLSFIEKPARFAFKPCKRCGEMFGTNYRGVAFCGDNCRARYLLETTGIRWNPHKSPEERWGGEPPMILPPAAVKKLLQVAQMQSSELSEDGSESPEVLGQLVFEYDVLLDNEQQKLASLSDNPYEEQDPSVPEKTIPPVSKPSKYSVEDLMAGISFGSD